MSFLTCSPHNIVATTTSTTSASGCVVVSFIDLKQDICSAGRESLVELERFPPNVQPQLSWYNDTLLVWPSSGLLALINYSKRRVSYIELPCNILDTIWLESPLPSCPCVLVFGNDGSIIFIRQTQSDGPFRVGRSMLANWPKVPVLSGRILLQGDSLVTLVISFTESIILREISVNILNTLIIEKSIIKVSPMPITRDTLVLPSKIVLTYSESILEMLSLVDPTLQRKLDLNSPIISISYSSLKGSVLVTTTEAVHIVSLKDFTHLTIPRHDFKSKSFKSIENTMGLLSGTCISPNGYLIICKCDSGAILTCPYPDANVNGIADLVEYGKDYWDTLEFISQMTMDNQKVHLVNTVFTLKGSSLTPMISLIHALLQNIPEYFTYTNFFYQFKRLLYFKQVAFSCTKDMYAALVDKNIVFQEQLIPSLQDLITEASNIISFIIAESLLLNESAVYNFMGIKVIREEILSVCMLLKGLKAHIDTLCQKYQLMNASVLFAFYQAYADTFAVFDFDQFEQIVSTTNMDLPFTSLFDNVQSGTLVQIIDYSSKFKAVDSMPVFWN